MKNKTRTDIINDLIKKNKYKSFLEIGYQSGVNFDGVKCKFKTSVDPFPLRTDEPKLIIKTSDDFFNDSAYIFNIVFIDGSHMCEQVRKDIINASKSLTKQGCIVCHDLLPPNEKAAGREICDSTWNGDCFRAAVGFAKKYPDVEMYVHKDDWGVGVIFPNGQIFDGDFEDMEIKFDEFNETKHLLLNII